jgi:hypothetical protein
MVKAHSFFLLLQAAHPFESIIQQVTGDGGDSVLQVSFQSFFGDNRSIATDSVFDTVIWLTCRNLKSIMMEYMWELVEAILMYDVDTWFRIQD